MLQLSPLPMLKKYSETEGRSAIFAVLKKYLLIKISKILRGVPPRRIEGARLESVYTGNRIEGRDDPPWRIVAMPTASVDIRITSLCKNLVLYIK